MCIYFTITSLGQKESLIFSSRDISQTDVELPINKGTRSGKTGHAMIKISGRGRAYLKTAEGLLERSLETGEVLSVNILSIAALQSTINISATCQTQSSRDISTRDEAVMVDLSGPGKICLQSSLHPERAYSICQNSITLDGRLPIKNRRTDIWDFAHPSYYL